MENTNTLKLNSPAYVLISAILLIMLTIFTKEGNKTFVSLTSMFGELSKEILLVVIVLLIVIMIINIYDLDMDIKKKGTGNIIDRRVVEGLSGVSDIQILNTTDNDGSKSFCEKYQSNPILMNKQCKKLNKSSCKIPSCCIWLNDEKCVSGGISGPTFKSDENDNEIKVKNFYYQGKCYGDDCE